MNELNHGQPSSPNDQVKWAAAHDNPSKQELPAAPLERLVLHPSEPDVFIPATDSKPPFDETTIKNELNKLPETKVCDGVDLQLLIRGDLRRQNVAIVDKKTGRMINGITKCVIDIDADRPNQLVTLTFCNMEVLGLADLFGYATVDNDMLRIESPTELLECRETFVVNCV